MVHVLDDARYDMIDHVNKGAGCRRQQMGPLSLRNIFHTTPLPTLAPEIQ